MDIAVEDLAGGITKIVLRGRFDTTGAVVVELPFNKVVTEKSRVMVDLSDVNFLASYAIRVLLVGAKIAHEQRRQAGPPVPRQQRRQGARRPLGRMR